MVAVLLVVEADVLHHQQRDVGEPAIRLFECELVASADQVQAALLGVRDDFIFDRFVQHQNLDILHVLSP